MRKTPQKYIENTERPAPHTGEMLKALYKKRRIRKAALARKINRRASTLASFAKNHTIQTAVLWELSHALKHNFFADIAAQLPAEYATNVEANTTNTDRITQLERQVELLEAEKNVLLLAFRG